MIGDYAWDPLAGLYFVGALVVLGAGLWVLVHEHYNRAGRWYATVTTIIAIWIATLGLAVLGAEPAVENWWLRATFAIDPFTAPAVYGLALVLAGVRRRLAWLAWLPALAFAVIDLTAPWLVQGLESLMRGGTLDHFGWLGGLYFLNITFITGLGLMELERAQGWAITPLERREARVLGGGVLIGSLTFLDYWLPTDPFRAGYLTPFALGAAAVAGALAARRYHSFSIASAFGMDEVMRVLREAVLICDTEGRLRGGNQAACTMLGVEPAEMLRRPISDYLAPLSPDLDDGLSWTECVQDRAMYLLPAQGEPVEVSVTVEPLQPRKRVLGAVVVARDMTEANRMRQHIEVQRRYFAELFENAPEGIALLEAGTERVLRVNEEFVRMFGWTADEVLGRDLSTLVVPDDIEPIRMPFDPENPGAGVFRRETVRRRKDGTRIDVSVLARDLHIPGEPAQLYVIYRDISQQKAAERVLKKREKELLATQRLEAIGELAGGVAHGFNNLLTVIKGHVRFGLEGLATGQSPEADLHQIEEAAARAASLTQQLLAYSRRQALRLEALDLDAVIRETVGTIRSLVTERIRVETRLNANGLHVRADRTHLERVLINLAVNARDAIPDAGTVTIASERIELEPDDHRVYLWDLSPGRYVRIRVSDTGTGMEPEILERAFEPFFSTKSEAEGRGLGLATAFGFVMQSGGHLSAHSEPGVGSRFDVLLPETDSRPQAGAGSDTDPQRITSPGTVLVVEDEEAVRRLVVRVLEREGWDVIEACNGEEAERLIGEHRDAIGLVITDLVMPGMGGRELVERMRRTGPPVPVIFMSGYDDSLAAGFEVDSADIFLSKPFAPSDIVRYVGQAVSGEADAD